MKNAISMILGIFTGFNAVLNAPARFDGSKNKGITICGSEWKRNCCKDSRIYDKKYDEAAQSEVTEMAKMAKLFHVELKL